jgi:hypothetical protein
MHRTSRYPAFFIRNLFIIAIITSLIKAENVLSASTDYDAPRIQVTVELVLDHVPEYSIPAYSGPGFSSAQSDDVSGTLDFAIAYQNACVCHAQTVRTLLKVNGNLSHAAVPFLFHRFLPGESPDDDLIEIN